MNYRFLSFLLICIVFSAHAMDKDKSHLLAKSFDEKHFQAYIAMLNSQGKIDSERNAKVLSVPPADSFDQEDEFFYANMLFIQNVQELHSTKQVPVQLSLLLQRFAILSAEPGNSHLVNRFETMLKLVVTKAAQLSEKEQLTQLQSEYQKEKAQIKSWQEAAAFWKKMHEDASYNFAQIQAAKEKLESDAKQEVDTLKQENADLQAQLDKSKKELSETGYELWKCVGQKNGLQALTDVLRIQLAKGEQKLAHAKKETQRKSSENGRLKSRLKALEKANKSK